MSEQAFCEALERAIEVAPVPRGFDVVLWDRHAMTLLGNFEERQQAEDHRNAIIDAVISVRRRAIAA